MVDIANLRITATSDADKARAGLDALAVSADKAEAAADRLSSSTGKTSKSLDTVAGAAAKAAKSQDGVAGSATRAAQGVGQIGRNYADAAAKATIAASANDEVAGSAARAAAGLKVVGGTATGASREMNTAAGHSANLVSQFNDIGVMLAAGQNPLQLALQQGTQINQVLTQLGGGVGALRAIGGAFVGMINPMSLATIGIIAGGAALFQWITASDEASGKAKSAGEAINNLRDAVEAYTSAAEAARASSDTLRQTYGAVASEAQAALENIASIERKKALDSIAASTSLIFDNAAVSIRNASPYLQGYTDQVEYLDYSFKLSGAAADRVLASIRNLDTNQGPRKTAEAAQRLSASLEDAYGSYAKMPAKAQEVYRAAQDITVEAGKIVGQTDDWAASMSSVLSYTHAVGRALANIGGGTIGRAAATAEIAALKQGKTLAEASVSASRERARLESKDIVAGLNIQNKYLRAGAEFAANAVAQADIAREVELDGLREIAREREREASKSGRKSGSGRSGGREESRRQRNVEGLVSELANERQALDLWYAEQSERLAIATEQELEAIGGKNAAKLALEQSYQDQIRQLQDQARSHEVAAQRAMYGELAGLLDMFGGRSRAAAVTAIAINTALRLAETAQNTAAAQMRAYAELGPIAGAAAAAKIALYGKIQMGLIAAAGAMRAAGSGGGSAGGGSGGGGGSSSGASKPEAAPASPQDVTIDMRGKGRFTADEVEDMINQLQKQNKNGVKITVVRE